MSIEVCTKCPCRFAVGLFRCPQCQAIAPLFADRVTKETAVPRITVAEGPTNPKAQPGEPGYRVVGEGGTEFLTFKKEGEQPSAGTSSSTSASKPELSSSETPTLSDPPPPAPTTENLSSPGPLPSPASGFAGSTDGSTPATGSGRSRRQGSSTASRRAPARTADSRNAEAGE